ncbi:MAG: tetratricopeptide repeat protein, partial [Xanthomonadales bacterium]|nr:tetratricopeptide repeat protein [Xanthomonadales bacterium]
KAWAAIEEGRRIAPESPELDIAEAYYHYWGHLAYDEALAALNRAIQAIPNDAELYKVKGYTLRRAGRYAESIATLETAHELDPRNPLAAVTLAEFAVFLGRFDEAQRWIDEAGDTGPDGRWLTAWRGVLALMADADFDRAIHYLNVAGELNAGTIYWGWFARLASGRHQEALEVADFGPYTEYAAGAYPSEVMIGITHRVMGEPKLAAPMLSEAREALSQLIESDPRYLRPMCLAAGGQQDLDAAQNYCAEAVARARPDAFDINNVRWEAAQGLAMAGDEEGALNMLEGMLENPARVRATVLRVDPLLENLRDHPRFEPLLERIDQVEPLD